MNPYAAYRQQTSPGWTRVDSLLALFDRAIGRGEQALEALAGGNHETARRLLARAQLVVGGLAAGVAPDGELASQFTGLYTFAMQRLAVGEPQTVQEAIGVLRTLREGFEGVRGEAIEWERNGIIPPLDDTRAIHALA